MNRQSIIAAARLSILYAISAWAWIVLSDTVVSTVTDSSSQRLQTFKGFGFVAVTALFLYILMRRELGVQANTRRALEESQRTLATLMSNLPGMVYRCRNDAHWTMEFVSEGCIDLTGYQVEDLFHNRVIGYADLIHPDDQDLVRDSVEAAMREDRAFQMVYRIKTAAGEEKWVWEQGRPVALGGQSLLEGFITDITPQRRATEALAEREAQFRAIFEASPVGICQLDPDGRPIRINPAIERALGYSLEELRSQEIASVYPDDPAPIRDAFQAMRAGQLEQYQAQHRLVSRSGQPIWCQVNAALVRNADGTPGSAIILAEDVTERKRTEEALAKRSEEVALIYEAGRQLGQTLDLNDLYDRIYGVVSRIMDCDGLIVSSYSPDDNLIRGVYARHEGLRMDATQFPPIPLQPEGTGTQSLAIRAGESLLLNDYQSYVKSSAVRYYVDGEHVLDASQVPEDSEDETLTRSALIVPLKHENQVTGVLQVLSYRRNAFTQANLDVLNALGPQVAIAIMNAHLYDTVNGYARELEQRVLARTEELNRAKERVETILDNTTDVIILLRPDGAIEQANRMFNRIVPMQPDQIVGCPVTIIVSPPHDDALAAAVQAVATDHQPRQFEVEIKGKPGTLVVEVSLSPILTSDQQMLGIVCNLHDITAHKQLERHLRQMLASEIQLNEMKSQFVSMVSHEFRTPLAVIQTSTDLLARYSDRLADEQKSDEFARIQTTVQSMVDLLDNVLIISRGEAGLFRLTPEPVDMEVLCHILIGDLERSVGAGHNFTFDNSGACAPVAVDPHLVKHILTNLLTNAIKYSPAGSTISLNLRCGIDEMIVSVSDRGIGIPSRDQDHLFEPFYRAGNVAGTKGTGLGLAIVKQSIELHGGTISFTSEEGVGTTFEVCLPYLPPEDDSADAG